MQTQASSLTPGSCLTPCEEHSSRTRNCPPGLPRLGWKQKLATNLQLRAQQCWDAQRGTSKTGSEKAA